MSLRPHEHAQRRTVPGLLDAVAARDPTAPAVRFPGEQLSYAELVAAAELEARRLVAAGVRPGDRVGVLLSHASARYVALAMGAIGIGAIVVPLSARYKSRELSYVLGHADIGLLVTSSGFAPLLERAAVPGACRVVMLDAGDDFWSADPAIGPEQVRDLQLRVTPGDAARIIYTSGTTAHPKGCVHTHAALVAQAEAVADRLRLSPRDRYWTPLPMFHTAGWTMLAALARGASFHHAGLFDPGAAVEQIASEACTVLFPGFETIWLGVLDHPQFQEADLTAVRLVVIVGVPERMLQMQQRLPHAPHVGNTGMTESSGWLAIGEATDSLAARTHTCGRPLAGMEVRIVDPGSGEAVPDGTPGELVFRGPSRLLEYYGDPEASAAAIDSDGWFHSGDLLHREPDGNLVFLSRLKDMLKVGGENVAAAEIEGFLLSNAAVHIAQVVGARDARYGEVPAAFVELKPGAEISERELIDFCIGEIATFKVPRYVRFVDGWPMSGTKIKKVDLRSRIAEELQVAGIQQAPPITLGRGRSET